MTKPPAQAHAGCPLTPARRGTSQPACHFDLDTTASAAVYAPRSASMPHPMGRPMTPAPRAGVLQACSHPKASHQHGTLAAWRADGCRCPACTLARAAAHRHRAQAVITGFWNPFSDAEPVRQHLDRLRGAGIGVDQIARLSGVPGNTVRAVIYGRHGRPVTRLKTTTATRLTAIRATATGRAPRSTVDATHTRAQLQQLLAVGLQWPDIAAELGRTPANLRRTMRRSTVTVQTARTVARLHRRITAGRQANTISWGLAKDDRRTETTHYAPVTANDKVPAGSTSDALGATEQSRCLPRPPHEAPAQNCCDTRVRLRSLTAVIGQDEAMGVSQGPRRQPPRNRPVHYVVGSGVVYRPGLSLPPVEADKLVTAAKAMDCTVSGLLTKMVERLEVDQDGAPVWFERPNQQGRLIA